MTARVVQEALMESPFTPGVPAPIDVFRGRWSELRRLQTLIDRASGGRPQFAYIAGERGIGKSSLAAFATAYARHNQNMATAHAFLGGCKGVEGLVRRILDELLRAGREQSWFERAKGLFGRVEQVGLFGVDVRLVASSRDIAAVARSFPSALKALSEKLASGGDPRSGLVIVLDDINGLSTDPDFAHWLKSTVDKMATMDGPVPVALILVGLEERRQELVARVPSLARVFDLMSLQPWPDEEAREFFTSAFESVGMKVTEDALFGLARYSGGLPTLAQELGDAVFRLVQGQGGSLVDDDQVIRALLDAAEIIGRKHIGPQVLEAIRGPTYLTSLQKLGAVGSPLRLEFSRAELCEHLDARETKNVDNFLRRMKELGLIVSLPERGTYRFVTHLARVFMWLESRRPKG